MDSSSKMLCVADIIRQWLHDNGYNGLYHENDCGCLLDDLIPCGEDCSTCVPGYMRAPQKGEERYGECEWVVGPKRDSN